MESEEFWNSINLISPPFSTYSMSRKTFDIQKLKTTLENAITHLGDQTAFNAEINQISQFIYLGKNQFRMMKGFQEMKKTHQAANRLKKFNIVSCLEIFNSHVADDFQSDITLPHRQNLDYLLIKLQGLSKILIRIVICSRKSSKYFLGMIRNGSFYMKGSIFVASLAKVWNLGRQMCQYTVVLYNNLREFRVKLKEINNLKWAPNNCNLPDKLDKWLGDEYEFYVFNETYDSKLLTKEEDIENFRRNITQVTEIFEKLKSEVIPKESKIFSQVVIKNARNDLEMEDVNPISRIKNIEASYEHLLPSIQSRENIKLFLKFEEKYRKIDAEKSLTIKKLNKKEWKEIKEDLKNKLLLMQESSLVEYFHDNINYYLEKT